jgi:activator of HSP90 ATPase
MKTKTLHQSVMFKASPHDLFEAFMDSKKHSEFTGAEAHISRNIGGEFRVWDDWATGMNLEVVPDKKIVQKWRGGDWPEGHYSVVTFEFQKKKGGTLLEFSQTEIPEELYEDIAQGWNEWYWEKLKLYLQ